jgi:O-antigen ligase
MSIRITALALIVIFLSGYAWRNSFHSLLGAIVLFAFLESPDMPRMIAGVPGLNLWNLLFVNITAAWLIQRADESPGPEWPPLIRLALLGYIGIIIIAFARAFIEPTSYYEGTRLDLTLNYLINPLKFLLPALMLYDGCNTQKRVNLAISAILIMYFLLALQSIKAMGLHHGFSAGEELSSRAARVLPRDVGYNRVDLSMMFAGAGWAVFATAEAIKLRWMKYSLWCAAAVILIAQAVTGGRTGYVTWALIGLTLCIIKWRRLLPIIPIAAAIALMFLPAVRNRILEGFTQQKGNLVSQMDAGEITSGRTRIWPYVIDEIAKAPLAGHGRLAMTRTGLSQWSLDTLGEAFGHPHNAYLEILLDDGVLGFIAALPIYLFMLVRSYRLFLDHENPMCEIVGGVSLALLLALLIAGVGAQTFYPREGVVGMWAALAIALRISIHREQMDYGLENTED